MRVRVVSRAHLKEGAHPLEHQIGTIVKQGKFESTVRFGYNSDRKIKNVYLASLTMHQPKDGKQ